MLNSADSQAQVSSLIPVDNYWLLYDLCVRLGFCLPAKEEVCLVGLAPDDPDDFTDAVMWAEGLDPQLHQRLRQQVRKLVVEHFERAKNSSPAPGVG